MCKAIVGDRSRDNGFLLPQGDACPLELRKALQVLWG